MLQTLRSSGQSSRSQCIDAFWDTEDSEFKIKRSKFMVMNNEIKYVVKCSLRWRLTVLNISHCVQSKRTGN